MLAMVVVAFLAMLTQAESCGNHATRITDLQLAPDGQTLAVSRADARIYWGNYHRYINDLWLTRLLIKADQGKVIKVLESRPSTGSGGEFRTLHDSPWFSFSQQHVYFPSHDRELVCCDFQGRQKSKVALPGGVACVAVSADEKHWLYSDILTNTAFLIKADNRQVLWAKAVKVIGMRYFGCAVAISDEQFATLDHDELKYGNLGTKVAYKTKPLVKNGNSPNAVHLVNKGSLVLVAFDNYFDLVDVLSGRRERVELTLLGRSPDGGRLVVDSEHGLQLMDLNTGERSQFVPTEFSADIACVSNDGQRLFVGHDNGRISCIDTLTRKRLWSSTVPGHNLPSRGWLIFLAVVGLWGWGRYRRRSNKRPNEEQLSSVARGAANPSWPRR